MTHGLFSNTASAFRQPSSPFSSDIDLSAGSASQALAQASNSPSDSLQNSTLSNKGQQVSAQDLALQTAAVRHLRQRLFATQILVAQFSANSQTQEALQATMQEALLLTHAGKFTNIDEAVGAGSSRPSIGVFLSSEAGQRTLQFLRASEREMNPSSLRILVQAARSLAPSSRYLGRVLALGVFFGFSNPSCLLPLSSRGKLREQFREGFVPTLLSLGHDFLYETQSALSIWGSRFEYVFTHSLPDNYHHWCEVLFSQSAEERNQQAQAEQAETLMQIVRAASPQMADQAMRGDLGQQVGLNEMENALGRASIIFASNSGDQISMMSNYAASVASGYLSAILSRTRFSGYALALAAVGGGLNGAVQSSIGLAHQMGNMSSEQLHHDAVPLLWQFFKGVFIGVGSGVSEYAIGGLIHSLPIHNPLLHMGVGLAGFLTGDVGGEVVVTNALTWVGVSLGLEQEHILEAGGIYGFAANAIDELGGGVTNHFNVVNLMNVGAVGSVISNAMRDPVDALERPTRSLAITRDDNRNTLSLEGKMREHFRQGEGVHSASNFQEPASKISIFEQVYQFTSLRFYNCLQTIGDFFQDVLFSQAFLFMGMGGVGATGKIPRQKREAKDSFQLNLDLELNDIRSEEQILDLVREIVKQDKENYPKNGALLSAGYSFLRRSYSLGKKTFLPITLCGRVRLARGYPSNDTKSLKDSDIVAEWRSKICEVATEEKCFVLNLEGAEFKERLNEEEILEIIKAIVKQDTSAYPTGSFDALLKPANIQRRYALKGKTFCVDTLCSRYRQSKGLAAGARSAMKNLQILQLLIEQIRGEKIQVQGFLLKLEGVDITKKLSELEILEIVKAILEQDIFYQNDPNNFTGRNECLQRGYVLNGRPFTLVTLLRRVRVARGYTTKKLQKECPITNAQILAEWKEKIFGIIPFSQVSENELEKYVSQNNLQEILNLFSSDSLVLREMLKLLKPEVFKHADVDQFIQAYVGLKVTKESASKIQQNEVDTWELRRRYLAALTKAIDESSAIDLSEESFQHQLDLLIRLSRSSYQENPKQFVSQIQESILRSEHPFMRRLQEETLKYFEADEKFELVNMKTKASSYLKEGARFLTTHDLAILSDEVGMGKSYQAIAAVEHLKLKRVLWVTTASTKENIKREIMTHAQVSEKDIRVVISGDPAKRSEQIQALNGERYRITNYETLVALQKNDPAGYEKLTEGLDVIIVDEAQMTDNAGTLRQKAIAGISTPRKWLLTATPYQNKPEKFWTLLNYLDAKQYPDFQAFKNLYCKSSRGLELLHAELRRYMLRRTKRHTLLNFKDPSEVPFEKQLQNDALRLPHFERLDPKIWGHYDLSSEQSDLIAWMIADYRGWATAFNENLPAAAEPIDLNNINPLEKFENIHKVIYSPEMFGISTPNPLYAKLDARVEEKLAAGEKVILWAWNTEVIDELERRYSNLSPHPNPLPQGERGRHVVRIDGTVTGTAREKAIQAFQNDPNAKILVANFVSGGVGLTLTAATTAIAVQLPLQYSLMYQMEGRHHRLIGLNNIQHAKYEVGMEYLIPQYPAEFLESLADEKLATLMKAGTLVEQSFSRLMGAELLYRLVMEGYGDPEKLDAYFKQGLLKSLGLTGSEKIDYTGHLKNRVRQEAEVLQALLPLWNMFAGSEKAQDQVLRLMDAYLHYPEQAKALGAVFEKAAQVYPKDLKIILSLFEFKNKHIREQLLKRLPRLMIELYQKGESLESVAVGLNLKMNRLNPANLIALMYVKAGLGSEAVIAIARRLAEHPRRRYLEEHYVTAIFGLMGVEEAQGLLDKIEPLLRSAQLEDAVHVLYRLGLLARCGKEVLSEITLTLTLSPQGRGDSGGEFEKFNLQFENYFYQILGEHFAVTSDEIQEQVSQNKNWFGSADPVLALMLGWQEYENHEVVEKFQEAMMQVFEGKHKEWRLENGATDFLSDEEEGEAYWERIGENSQTNIAELLIEAADSQRVRQASYANLLQEVSPVLNTVEGSWVKEELEAWVSLDHTQKIEKMTQLQEQLRQEAQKLTQQTEVAGRMQVLSQMKPLKDLLCWMQLQLALERGSSEQALQSLNQKEKRYRERGYDKLADHFLEFIHQFEQEISNRRVFKDITIEDTDDAALFIRMGALHPELLNCFNPNANPTFTQNVVAALGSKNMRLVVVREQGKMIAVAMMKVKQTEEGEPVLFLEKGLYRKGYDFRREMLNHLLKKAEDLPIATKVATQIMGKARDEDPVLLGTGAYTKNVYEEAVFGLRAADNVRHKARLFSSELSLPRRERVGERVESTRGVPLSRKPCGFSSPLQGGGKTAIGIGTSNKKIEVYIAELKAAGVTCVVDVRQNPQSQYFPHFNKKAFETALAKEGIRYVFMGDTLGNPKIGGERSLENFEQQHRLTEAYQRGLKLLLELIRENEGKLALTCSEGKEHDCHRKFILRDLLRCHLE